MSILHKSWAASLSVAGARKAFDPDFSDSWPALTEVLLGVCDDKGKVLFSPSTVMLFVDAGRLKFSINPKDGNSVAFGCIMSPGLGLDALEDELISERFEWKTKREKR